MTYITPSEHRHKLRMQYLEDSKRDPVFVPLGVPGQKRLNSLDDKAYEREVEYELDQQQRLLAEVNGVEQTRDRGIRINVRRNNQLIDEAQRQYEMTRAAHAGQQWAGQERWQGKHNEEARKVNILHCREFVRRLARAGVHVWLNDFSKLLRIGVNARVLDFDEHGQPIGRKNKTLTTLQYPWSYEWSVMRFDEYDVPTQEKYRGWRTALLVLIGQGACTEEQAHEALGKPFITTASEFYREQLWNMRNLRGLYERPVAGNLDAKNLLPRRAQRTQRRRRKK